MPLLNLEYPQQFPSERQAAVEYESMQAAKDLALPADPEVPLAELEQRALRWVCRVLGGFAHQACELAKAQLWTVKQVRDEVMAFRLQLVQAAHFQLSETRLGWVDRVFGTYVHPDICRQIGNSAEWQGFQNEFLELADHGARGWFSADLTAESGEVRDFDPEALLAGFMSAHPRTTYADIKYSANVHTADFQRWRKGELKRSSAMAERIEKVLRGQLRLKKRPAKKLPVFPANSNYVPDRKRKGPQPSRP